MNQILVSVKMRDYFKQRKTRLFNAKPGAYDRDIKKPMALTYIYRSGHSFGGFKILLILIDIIRIIINEFYEELRLY